MQRRQDKKQTKKNIKKNVASDDLKSACWAQALWNDFFSFKRQLQRNKTTKTKINLKNKINPNPHIVIQTDR